MSGLNLMGGVKVAANTGSTTSKGSAGTATQMAFGPGYSQTGKPSNSSALLPNDPFGIGFWASIAAIGVLLVVRHSLPR